jgi:hypothetical protein
MESEEILFIHYHQDLLEQQRFKSLFKALGVLWQKSDLDTKGDVSETDEVFIPLSMVINPKVLDLVKSNRKSKDQPRLLGDGSAIDPELGPVMSMGDLPKEDFFRMIGQQMPSKLPASAKEELKKKWIKSKQG